MSQGSAPGDEPAARADASACAVSRPTSRSRSSTTPDPWDAPSAPTHGTVDLPLHLYWTDGNNRFDLDNRPRLRSLYQVVLTEGTDEDVRAFVHPSLLVDVWDELWLAPAVHAQWDAWIASRRHSQLRAARRTNGHRA